ncbi:oligosaccharide flippase family protein [Nakamurella endophytica]|uniref:Polysaccharide biosynthesis protein C-terminal domain-containing protein n=1 Tax=Nakamurella endophytica TaxID=1748367 RepID=A0A917SQC2_9ACTN|nr:polysaccharide biosynthesis C-terminal domain-containing protein [Nakamurella endophytica]GGL91399.1 hypothetical protein GCM10011594_08960 [Nakamurella endophytica]
MATTAIGNAVVPLASLVTMPILSYGLGVDGRGQVAAASGPLLLATTAATFGVPEAVTYLVARTPASVRVALRHGALMLVLAGLAGTAACAAVAGVLSDGDPVVGKLIVLAALALAPTLLVLVLRASAAGLHRWRLVAAEQVVSAFVRLVGIGGLAVAGHLTPLTATVVIAAAPVLGGLAYLPLRRHTSAAVAQGPVPVAPRAILGFGSRIWLGSLSGVLLSRLDQAIMTPLSGTYQLGLYAVAVSISDVALVVNSAMRDVTFASDAAQRDDSRLTASARISFFLSLLIGLALAAALPWGMPLLFGPGFAAAVPAGFILLAAVVLITPGSIAGAGLSARGRPGLRSTSLFVACVINVVALFVLVPPLGAVGAALATLVGNMVSGWLNILFLHRVGGTPIRHFWGLRRSDLRIIGDKAGAVLSRVHRTPDRQVAP